MVKMNGNTNISHLDDNILSLLRSNQKSLVTRKEIQKELLTKDDDDVSSLFDDVTKKDVKRALKRLVKRGDVEEDGKRYKAVPSKSDSEDGNSSSSNLSEAQEDNNISDSDDEEEEASPAVPFVPIAERIRQTAQAKQSDDDYTKSKQQLDLDEEIRRLEAELAQSDDDESDDDHDEDESDDHSSIEENVTAKGTDGIICLSTVADERIVPLPQGALPQNKRRTLKNIDAGDNDDNGEPKRSKKRKSSTSKEEHVISEGLKDAVNDLLSNYVPSSHLKKPFYCRVCQHQSENESEFLSHKQSEFHKGAVQQEKKRTYCKLCRKQLTSIVQMEEHLKSRPHREKMDFVKSKQAGGGGRSRGRGQVAGGKQWC